MACHLKLQEKGIYSEALYVGEFSREINATSLLITMKVISLGKERRIRKRDEFKRIFEKGTRINDEYFSLVHCSLETRERKLGIIVSKRCGSAARRNRIKRIIRELFRTSEEIPEGTGLVFITRYRIGNANRKDIERNFSRLIRFLH